MNSRSLYLSFDIAVGIIPSVILLPVSAAGMMSGLIFSSFALFFLGVGGVLGMIGLVISTSYSYKPGKHPVLLLTLLLLCGIFSAGTLLTTFILSNPIVPIEEIGYLIPLLFAAPVSVAIRHLFVLYRPRD